jgi:hypothetical protein
LTPAACCYRCHTDKENDGDGDDGDGKLNVDELVAAIEQLGKAGLSPGGAPVAAQDQMQMAGRNSLDADMETMNKKEFVRQQTFVNSFAGILFRGAGAVGVSFVCNPRPASQAQLPLAASPRTNRTDCVLSV